MLFTLTIKHRVKCCLFFNFIHFVILENLTILDLALSGVKCLKMFLFLSFIILRALASGLGLKEDFFAEMFDQPSVITLGLWHYPSCSGDTSSFGVGPHTDYGMCTIVLQDIIGGLEADIDGKWVKLKPIPG